MTTTPDSIQSQTCFSGTEGRMRQTVAVRPNKAACTTIRPTSIANPPPPPELWPRKAGHLLRFAATERRGHGIGSLEHRLDFRTNFHMIEVPCTEKVGPPRRPAMIKHWGPLEPS